MHKGGHQDGSMERVPRYKPPLSKPGTSIQADSRIAILLLENQTTAYTATLIIFDTALIQFNEASWD